MARYLVCITGASGAIYGIRLLRALSLPGHGTAVHDLYLVASDWGERVIAMETGKSLEAWIRELQLLGGSRITRFESGDFSAPVSSGSFRLDGTLICPCSMGTVGSLASGTSSTLVHRAGSVALKEGWPLIIVPRESPVSVIDLKNMTRLAEAGASLMPASPGFYQKSESITELVDGFISRILDRLGARNPLSKPWMGSPRE